MRLNPRKAWYRNLDEVVDRRRLHRHLCAEAAAAGLSDAAGLGNSPVYPCHVPAGEMRNQPIGTGPFKFVEFKPNEYIKFAKNPDYWKPGLPYLDAIEWTIIPNRSTQTLAFIAGQFDMTFPYEETVQTMHDIKSQAPTAICEIDPTMVSFNLMVNRDNPPFNDPDMRKAMMLTIDRKAFIDIIAEGQGQIGGAMQSPPAGLWGLPPEILQTLPGYGPDVEKSRAEARKLMEKHGYGPEQAARRSRSQTRNIAQYRDPARDPDRPAEAHLYRRRARRRRDRQLVSEDRPQGLTWSAANLTGSGVDDPDAYFYEHYACGSERNYTNYCNPELEKMYDQQSMEPDQEKRKKIVWEIDKNPDRGRRPADRLPLQSRHLPLSAGARRHDDGQQHLQRLALREHLARPVAHPRAEVPARSKCVSI